MPRINVLFLLPSARAQSPILGTLAMIEALERDRCEPTVWFLDGAAAEGNTILPALRAIGVRSRVLGMTGWWGARQWRKLGGEIAGSAFHAVHSYGIRPDLANAFLSHGRVRLSFLREDFAKNYTADFGAFPGALATGLEVAALRRMDRIVVISPNIRERLIGYRIPEERVAVVPNLMNPERLASARDRIRLTRRADRAGTRIGCMARLIPLKRVDWVIRATAALNRDPRNGPLTLEIAGEGPLRSRLAAFAIRVGAGDLVTFSGHVADVGSFFERVDLVALTSSSEGVPRSLMEAMYAGLTCVAPRVGGITEIIEDGKTGFLFDPDRYEDFEATLARVIAGEFPEPEVVSASIMDYSNPAKVGKQLLDTYVSAVESQPSWSTAS